MKSDGKLSRNYLKGTVGDENNAILCGIGLNLRVILRKLKIFFVKIFYFIKKIINFDESKNIFFTGYLGT